MKRAIFISFIASLIISGELFAGTTDIQRIDTLTVEVWGTSKDARFVPTVIKVNPGDTIQFVVQEGLHTISAYHPDNRRPLRIPESATPFDSGLLQAGDIWFLKIESEGVYDYFCLPHERMGHVGRILSGPLQSLPDYPTGQIPKLALEIFNAKTTSF